jgi:hypothetical protein
MDWLLVYGSIAVATMLLVYALEDKASVLRRRFAAACAASSVYGWPAAAYPIGVLEAIWAAVALKRWQRKLALESSKVGQA